MKLWPSERVMHPCPTPKSVCGRSAYQWGIQLYQYYAGHCPMSDICIWYTRPSGVGSIRVFSWL